MRTESRGALIAVAVFVTAGAVSGLIAVRTRVHAEMGNRRVEIALEWPEVQNLAIGGHTTTPDVLRRLKNSGATTLVVAEDTLAGLELAGEIEVRRVTLADGSLGTVVRVASTQAMAKIRRAAIDRGLPVVVPARGSSAPPRDGAVFTLDASVRRPVGETFRAGSVDRDLDIAAPYASLRSMGLGLPPEAVAAAHDAGLRIAGRIGNFTGVNSVTARAVLKAIYSQGASTVIFLGDDVLGYRGEEKYVANLLRHGKPLQPSDGEFFEPPTGLTYGDVEFGKQRGAEKLARALSGDFVRVHSVQTAELGQMSVDDVVDRFVKAVRERNIRFCYVRLPTFVGTDPVIDNSALIARISRGVQRGGAWLGGGYALGGARPFPEIQVSPVGLVAMGLGVGAGAVWLVILAVPLRRSQAIVSTVVCALVCAAAVFVGDDTGRKMVALLAGIVFPTIGCLIAFPATNAETRALNSGLLRPIGMLALASAITGIGAIYVVGLLASRPFMVHSEQFMGIKAQHVLPILLIGLCAIAGGPPRSEIAAEFRSRATSRIARALDEPARYGLLLLALAAGVVLVFVLARTGNDSGVAVSSAELEGRSILDRFLVARPRTKEFLVGYPAFVIAWRLWLTGKRRFVAPLFVVGVLGQASLLNTFCHIHTPLIVSVWRAGIGLLLGALLGVGAFLFVESVSNSHGAAARSDARAAAAPSTRELADDA